MTSVTVKLQYIEPEETFSSHTTYIPHRGLVQYSLRDLIRHGNAGQDGRRLISRVLIKCHAGASVEIYRRNFCEEVRWQSIDWLQVYTVTVYWCGEVDVKRPDEAWIPQEPHPQSSEANAAQQWPGILQPGADSPGEQMYALPRSREVLWQSWAGIRQSVGDDGAPVVVEKIARDKTEFEDMPPWPGILRYEEGDDYGQ